jgi:hypothetical protein
LYVFAGLLEPTHIMRMYGLRLRFVFVCVEKFSASVLHISMEQLVKKVVFVR